MSHKLQAMRRGSSFATVLVAITLSAPPAHACIAPRTASIDRGASPRGEKWEVSASIRNNGPGACGDWLFAINFKLPEIATWGSATGIPVGGHLSRYYDISASDDESLDGTERVFSGFTGREVAVVAMAMTDGKRIEVRPRFPSEKLRKHFVWLRSFRYFVRYYPPESSVASVSLFNKAGTLLYRTSAKEGFF